MQATADALAGGEHSLENGAETGRRGDSCDEQGVSRLFSSVLGDAQSITKCAGRTARRLEEQFIIDGWPTGKIYGSEIDLATHYGIGRAIVRETARILEVRGTARMRRGRHGGLELTAPSAERVHDMICGYCCLIGVSPAQVQSAQRVLDRVAAYMATERGAHLEFVPLLDRSAMDNPATGENLRRLLTTAAGNPVLTFYGDCLAQLRETQLPGQQSEPSRHLATGSLSKCIDRLVIAISRGDAHAAAAWAGACATRIEASRAEDTPVSGRPESKTATPHLAHDAVHRTRAGQIFHSLMARVGPGQWVDGYALGNEFELCERYHADRGVLRQAIRILEAAEAATSLPGRGRGLVARTPGPASVSRLICCHFAANRAGYHQSFQAFKWLSVEMVALAARRGKPADLEPIDAAIAALSRRTDIVRQSELMAVEERQFALAGHPVLELFLRSAKAFPSWAMHGNLPVPPQALRNFVECSSTVTAAIAAHNPVAAAAAQEHKFMLLEHNFNRIFEKFRSGSLALSHAG